MYISSKRIEIKVIGSSYFKGRHGLKRLWYYLR
jgi:hypothetical protein